MPDCRRHILASHRCPSHVLGGDRLELVMDCSKGSSKPLTISSSGIIWGQFSEKEVALDVFHAILAGRKDPLVATKPAKESEKATVQTLRLIQRKPSANDETLIRVPAALPDAVPMTALIEGLNG